MWTYNRAFFGTKLLLVSLLFLVPKQFDTSSEILFPDPPKNNHGSFLGSVVVELVVKLVRKLCIWDSVFYISAAHRGSLIYEHEWAFGFLWSKTIQLVGSKVVLLLSSSSIGSCLDPIYCYAIVGVILANICHYLAGLVLLKLTLVVKPRDIDFANNTAIAFACSSAGMFLMSSYAEPAFALISFSAMYCRSTGKSWIAAVLFAFSCGFRSNGLLWGIYYLYDCLISVRQRRLLGLTQAICQGLLIALAFSSIQALAYKDLCIGGPNKSTAAWCDNVPPLIYPYIQREYWNNGFLKYWTVNNIPNFMFALPTLMIMFYSTKSTRARLTMDLEKPLTYIHMAMPVLALFFWHVQIITRVSTCLPTIYWYVANIIGRQEAKASTTSKKALTLYIGTWLVVQGILFSAYLPPA